MKQITYTLSALVLFISLNAYAQKQRSGNGKIVTTERNIPHFEELKVSGSFQVELTPSLKGKITILADENLMDEIITEVKDGALIIRNKKNSYFKSSNRKRIEIKVPHVALEKAKLSGSGKIYSQAAIHTSNFDASLSGSGKITLSIQAKKVIAQLSGSGKIQLDGKSDRVNSSLSGSGSIRLQELNAQDAKASLSGSGSIYLRCAQNLDATVAGSGRIRYFGEPKEKVHTKVAGSGSIRLAKE